MTNTDGNLSALRERELATDADIALADARAREQLEEDAETVMDLFADLMAALRNSGSGRALSLAITNVEQARFWAREHFEG